MPSPVTPNEIKNTLPNADSGICDRLKKVIIDFPRKVYAWFAYVYNDDGTFTEEFKQELCKIKCDDIGTTEPKPPNDDGGGGTLDKIGGLIAGAGWRHQGGIPLLWDRVDGADTYDIYRTPTIVAAGAQTTAPINVNSLQEEIPTDSVIQFDGNATITLSAPAIVGATAIYGTLVGTLADNEEGSLSASKANLIRKDMGTDDRPSYQFGSGRINERTDGTLLYVDEHGGRIHNPTTGTYREGVDEKTNIAYNLIKGGLRYNYWVVAKSDDGATSAFSDKACGFSKYVTNFSAETGATGLLFTSYEQPVPADTTLLRLVLRGGGGGGGGGGDYQEPATIVYHIKSLVYTDSTSLVQFTLGGASTPDIEHWHVGDELSVRESAITTSGVSKFDTNYTVAVINGNQFSCTAFDSNGQSPTNNGTTITGTNDLSFGKLYRDKDKAKVAIPGGGGGSGGFLVAVFDVTNLDKVRVRTEDSTSPTKRTVNYLDTGTLPNFQTVDNSGGGLAGNNVGVNPKTPYNHGGKGRASVLLGPGKGEPRAGQENANYTAPYFTVFEATADGGSNWTELARVADGGGGGYGDGFTVLVSLGGIAGKTHTTIPSASTTSLAGPGTAKLRALALGGTSGNAGKIFKKGIEGGKGRTPKYPGPLQYGTPGRGGFIWDGLRTVNKSSSKGFEFSGNIFFRHGNSVDTRRPGSGGSGCLGDTEEDSGAEAWGGHAIAGCAWITYSETAYDSF